MVFRVWNPIVYDSPGYSPGLLVYLQVCPIIVYTGRSVQMHTFEIHLNGQVYVFDEDQLLDVMDALDCMAVETRTE